MSDAPGDGFRVVTWNLEWAPRSRRERIARRLDELAPDILCATEADREILPAGGYAASTEADSGYGEKGGRRKAILWSRWPLDDVQRIGEPEMPPGRFVAATCHTPLGPLRLVGVCVPWSHANVNSGRHKGRRAWEDHGAYLAHLGRIIAGRDRGLPMLVLGDFNQRVPRTRAPRAMFEALTAALDDLVLVTKGTVPGIDRQVIDHIAHSPGIVVEGLLGTDRHGADGRPLSDHDAVSLTVRELLAREG